MEPGPLAQARPTILQIIPELDAGGAERTTVEMADAIVKAGGRAIVLAEGGRLSPEIEAAGAEFFRFPAATKNPLRMMANAAAIVRIIGRERVDLVHARSRAPAWSALMAARRTGVPFVTTYHGIYNEKSRAKSAYNSVMARGDIVIANSRYTAALIRERYRIDASRIVVVNRGVDVGRFDRAAIAPERLATLRSGWGVAPDARIVLHPARLTRWKGQTTVIAAAARLAQDARFEDTVFVLAGDAQGRDDYVGEIKSAIAAARIGARVRLVGHVTDMAAALATSSVVVIASIEPEAFGRTSVEAQAMGVPVIATLLGAPPDTVRAPPFHDMDSTTGRLVEPGDAVALASAIEDILSLTPSERQAMAERARANARSNFTTRALQQTTLSVYDRLLGTQLARQFEMSCAEQANKTP